MTDNKKIDLIKTTFKGRNDAYGVGKGMCIKEPVTDDIIARHLIGEKRIGIYPLSPNILDGSGTWWVAADIDDDDIGLVIQFCEELEHIEIPCYIERSKSKGYHVWVFFTEPIEAKWARGLMNYAINVLDEEADYRIDEIFPKQNTIKKDGSYGFGNYINLPFFGGDVMKGRTIFFNSNDDYKPYESQWDFLKSIEKISPQRLGEIMDANLIDFDQSDIKSNHEPSNRQDDVSDKPSAAEYYLKRAFAQGDIGNRNDTGFWLACQLRDLGLSEAESEPYLREYAGSVPQGDEQYTEREALATLKSAFNYPQREPAVPGMRKRNGELPSEDKLKELNKLHRTDTGNAEGFALLYGDDFRYDWSRKRWLYFDESRWCVDSNNLATQAIKEMAKSRLAAAALIDDDDLRKKMVKWALGSESRYRLKGALELAQSEPPFPASTEQFDRDPYLLGCANGVMNLRTGEFRQGRRDDYIMKSTLTYNPTAECPRWRQFLDEIFLGNKELIDFIHRGIGYSLTGDTSEQCLFICYGTGWNGKSKFLILLRALLGDYARNTPFSTFTERYRDTATNDVAALAGVRLVTSSEVGEGKRLNEARVKAMTGGDPITARFLYGEFFDYTPAYKVWLAVNHKPVIKGTDEGIWRRIRLIPFEACFKANPDPYIEEKLKAELEGILRWAVEGCLKWQRERLEMVEKVKTATDEYRQESDVIIQFLDECTIETEDAKVKASELYKAYNAWCEESGEDPITANAFGRRMGEKGYEKKRLEHGYHYLQIGLLADE